MHQSLLPKIFKPFHCSNLIRIGKDFDGGYLVNKDDVLKTKKLISFGIGEDFSFEKEFVEMSGCSCDSYDETVDLNLNFIQHHIQNVDKNEFVKILSRESGDVFLKCDIEGNEYQLFEEIINYSHLFSGMVFEFHDVTKPKNFNELTNLISKIDQKLIHIHINNYFYYKTPNGPVPDIFELTFTSSKNIKNSFVQIPNSLDMPNNPNDEQFEISY